MIWIYAATLGAIIYVICSMREVSDREASMKKAEKYKKDNNL
jgi:hypothetical protein